MTVLDLQSKTKSDPFNPIHHIALAKAYLEEGDEERARKIIAIKRKLPSEDHTIHFEWGELCEELGMSLQAGESYERAIALNPQNPNYHFRWALLLYEKGAWERALKHLQKTVSLSSQNEKAKDLLITLYEEIGFHGSAKMLKRAAVPKEYVPETLPFKLTEHDIQPLLQLFKGRETGYARYHFINSGSLTHSFIQGVIGFNEIQKHINGDETYGIYPLRSDRTLKFSLLQVEVPWRRILGNIKNSGFLAISEDQVQQHARRILEKVRDHGLFAYLEKPATHERRIWFFYNDFIPMGLAERFMNCLLDKIPAPGVDIPVMPFLGFKGSGLGWQDHPVMLPLGINKRTGGRCFFLDQEGHPHPNQMLLIQKMRTILPEEIKQFLKGDRIEPREHFGVLQDSFRILEQNCPVIKETVLKARSGRNLRDGEKRLIYFTLGFLKDGAKMIHEVLENCPDYRPKKVERIVLRLGSNPISCPKIRELLPETTAYLPCNCPFRIPEGGYPSPLLHIDPGLIPRREERLSSSPSAEEMVREYNALNARIEDLTKKRDELKLMLRGVQH